MVYKSTRWRFVFHNYFFLFESVVDILSAYFAGKNYHTELPLSQILTIAFLLLKYDKLMK